MPEEPVRRGLKLTRVQQRTSFPLGWLKGEADYIAECTGCASAEAVAFLLSDWLPDVPWIDVDAEMTIPTVVLRINQ